VLCRGGHLCARPFVDDLAVLRLSAYVYNTPDDIHRAFDALDELHPFMATS
jgi:selenocysteine lyase/cysteine desulfurase